MKQTNNGQKFDLTKYLNPNLDEKILALPLQFEYLPVEIISKQYTKLNSNHPYRIHYLGPRFTNTLVLHKKYSCVGNAREKHYFQQLLGYNKYEVQMRKILQSNYLNERMENNHYYKSSIFYRAFQGMNPTLNLKDEFIFNSCFESGNLDCVIKVNPLEFDLFLRIDSNTRGHTLWFYFSVQNGNKTGKVTFNLCNLTKPKALYQQGLRPYVFSKKRQEKYGQNWQQDGENLQISQKKLRYNIIYEMIDSLCVYKLSFDYNFTEQDDQVFFAYSIPYTYSQLLKDIQQMPTQFVKKYTLGRSLAGVDIPILHITNHQAEESKEKANKKNILIIGRAHPGQSNGSHLLKGFMDYLCSQSDQAINLRNKINFIIVPMSNPDGVILGNSRSSASGKDLNREYLTTKKQLYPQVFAIKSLAYKIQKNEGIFMFFDFHGHSQKKNTFFYGPPYILSESQYYKCRAFARIIEKINNNFRYYSCSFYIPQEKRGTARAVFFEQYKIPYVFTIESSIGLYYDANKMKTQQFTVEQWVKMGADVCLAVEQFIKAYQQYEQIIRERKRQRERRRQRLTKKSIRQRRFAEDNLQDIDNSTNINENKRTGLMFQMIEEIKKLPPPKNVDPQASSDDHDETQDLEAGKLKEFNNLVIQTKQKNQQMNMNKQSDLMFEEEPRKITTKKTQSESEQMQIMKEIVEQKTKFNKNTKSSNIVSLSFEKNADSNGYNAKRRSASLFSQTCNTLSVRKPQQDQDKIVTMRREVFRKVRKNMNIETHRHLVSKQFFPVDKCEIVDLPKTTIHMRKDIKKGRVLIDQYLKQKNMQKVEKQDSARKVKTIRHSIERFAKQQNQSKTQSLKKFKIQDLISSRANRASSHQKLREKKYPPYKGLEGFNRIFDSVFFSNFKNMEIDNMAMTIRTFNK